MSMKGYAESVQNYEDSTVIESEIIKRIKPTKTETDNLRNSAEKLKKRTEDFINENNLAVTEIRFVGSFAKDTYLSNPDLDLFLMFPPDVPREQLEREGLFAGEGILGGKRMYAEHPYIRGIFENYEVDMVPCYALNDTKKLKTSVDRTPFHTEFVLSRLGAKQKDQVRLLKKFMKGISVYGAEPDTRGFSGYLCELLVIRYGGFRQVMEAASNWREGTIVEIEGKGPATVAPLTVYDPVDSRRNAASAVHLDTLSLFIVASCTYLKQPSEKFFFPVERKTLSSNEIGEKIESHGTKLLTAMFQRPDVIEESLYSQLWKTEYALSRKLNDFGFGVLRTVHEINEELWIVFELERDALSKTFKHTGPPVWVKNAERFIEKWKENENGEPFIEDGNWNVVANRPYITPKELIYEEAAMSGIGRDLDPETMHVLNHEETLNLVSPILLTELLDPKLSWEN